MSERLNFIRQFSARANRYNGKALPVPQVVPSARLGQMTKKPPLWAAFRFLDVDVRLRSIPVLRL